jgi:hypothetical protein
VVRAEIGARPAALKVCISYQAENKMRALVHYELAGEIPLIK